jgi:RNA polymerase sigma-70 factor (ECF subfamily)
LQKTFLKIWDKIESYDNKKGMLFTWKAIIDRRTAISTIRLKNHQRNKETLSLQSLKINIEELPHQSNKIK